MGQLLAVHFLGDADPHRLMHADDVLVIGHEHLVLVAIDVHVDIGLLLVGKLVIALAGQGKIHALGPIFVVVHLADAVFEPLEGQVVGAQHHILGGHGDGAAVLGPQQVVGRQHQQPGLGLGLGGQGHMDSHLVAVEVGVEGGAVQGVQLQGAALHQHRLKGLDAQAVQGRRAVEHHRVVLDDELQGVPHLGASLVHHLLGGLDVVGGAVLHQLLHDEGTEQLHGHLLGHAALVDLQLGADDDNGTAGVVHALAQQVLAEAALLALEHVAEGLQGPVVGAGNGTAPAAVVDQGVHSLLEHALFIADDDVRGAELHQTLEAVVEVDDPAIQVVEVGGGKAAAVQLDHGAQLRGDHRQHVDDHPLRLVAGQAEGVHHLQALHHPGLLLAGDGFQLRVELGAELLQVDLLQQLLHGLGAHAGVEIVLILLPHVAVFLLGQQLIAQQGSLAGIGDDIRGEVQDLLQDPGADVQQQAHPGGDALEIPDMADGGGQLDVAHALPAHLGPGDLHAAAVADLALVADLLVLAAVALPVLGGAKDALAEQAVPLRLQGAVVDGLRLFDLAVRPLADLLRGGDANLNGVKLRITHRSISSLFSQKSSSEKSSPSMESFVLSPTSRSSSSLSPFRV